MSGLLKKIEFYKGESDHEQMVIAAGILGGAVSSPASRFFPVWGNRRWGDSPPSSVKS